MELNEYSPSTWRQTVLAARKLALRRLQETVTGQAGQQAWRRLLPWLLKGDLAAASIRIHEQISIGLQAEEFVTGDVRTLLRGRVCFGGIPALHETLREHVWGEVWEAARLSAWSDLWGPLADEVRSEVHDHLGDRQWYGLWRRLRSWVMPLSLNNHDGTRPLWWWKRQEAVLCSGPFDACWLGIHEAIAACVFQEFGPRARKSVRNPVMDAMAIVAGSGGFWMSFGPLVIAVDRPVHLYRDGRTPEDAHLLPLQYRDGWGCSLDRLDSRHPECQAAKVIRNTRDPARARARLEALGYENFLRGIRARPVQEDHHGALYRVWLRSDEPLAVVRVRNSTPESDGTLREFFLRVPPRIGSAREAVAWTFGLAPDEYDPRLES